MAPHSWAEPRTISATATTTETGEDESSPDDECLLLEGIKGDVPEHCHVLGGVAAPDAAVVLSKGEVEGPV